MVRRMFLVLTVALIMATMMVVAGPAFASHVDVHPFCGSGQEFAHKHIKDLAQKKQLGPAHGHTPGHHSGFAVCDPSGHAQK